MEKELMYMIIFNNFLLKSIVVQQGGPEYAKKVAEVCIKETEKVMEKVYGKQE